MPLRRTLAGLIADHTQTGKGPTQAGSGGTVGENI